MYIQVQVQVLSCLVLVTTELRSFLHHCEIQYWSISRQEECALSQSVSSIPTLHRQTRFSILEGANNWFPKYKRAYFALFQFSRVLETLWTAITTIKWIVEDMRGHIVTDQTLEFYMETTCGHTIDLPPLPSICIPTIMVSTDCVNLPE